MTTRDLCNAFDAVYQSSITSGLAKKSNHSGHSNSQRIKIFWKYFRIFKNVLSRSELTNLGVSEALFGFTHVQKSNSHILDDVIFIFEYGVTTYTDKSPAE